MPPITLRPSVPNRTLTNLCKSCTLRQRRSITTGSPSHSPSAGLAPLPSRQLLSVAGPDAIKFLQGIVTANVEGKGPDDQRLGYYAGFLNATGRMLHDVFIYNDVYGLGAEGGRGEAFLVEVDTDEADRLAKYMKRYKLRAKVNLRKIGHDEVSVWQAWDNNASAGGQLEGLTSDASRLAIKDPRAPGFGYRILQTKSQTPQLDLETTTQDAYTIRRYLTGIPEGQKELPREASLPQESNMDIMNGIDYHKGCYVGQELTIRTKHRGVVRKRVLPCIVYPKTSPAPSALEYNPSSIAQTVPPQTSIGRFEKRGRSAGKWLGGVGNIGLGLCRLEIMTDVTLPGETTQAVGGFSAEDEFLLEWEGEQSGEKDGVKVKAFVPDWLRAGLDGQR